MLRMLFFHTAALLTPDIPYISAFTLLYKSFANSTQKEIKS
jgi:hypothetical protein